jgi:hypothetical protein
MGSGAVAALVIGSIAAVISLVALGVFAINYRHKRLTNRKAQFQFYDSHIRLTDSPTQMMNMDQSSTRSSDTGLFSGKDMELGAEDKKYFHELEGSRRKTVYELEATPLPVAMTKQLPELPEHTKSP